MKLLFLSSSVVSISCSLWQFTVDEDLMDDLLPSTLPPQGEINTREKVTVAFFVPVNTLDFNFTAQYLPREVVESVSLERFKMRLGRYLFGMV